MKLNVVLVEPEYHKIQEILQEHVQQQGENYI